MQAGGGLGKWLEERCKKERLSLRQASIKIGISHTIIADLLNGAQASPRTIKKLAEAFSESGDHQKLALEMNCWCLPATEQGDQKGRRLVSRWPTNGHGG